MTPNAPRPVQCTQDIAGYPTIAFPTVLNGWEDEPWLWARCTCHGTPIGVEPVILTSVAPGWIGATVISVVIGLDGTVAVSGEVGDGARVLANGHQLEGINVVRHLPDHQVAVIRYTRNTTPPAAVPVAPLDPSMPTSDDAEAAARRFALRVIPPESYGAAERLIDLRFAHARAATQDLGQAVTQFQGTAQRVLTKIAARLTSTAMAPLDQDDTAEADSEVERLRAVIYGAAVDLDDIADQAEGAAANAAADMAKQVSAGLRDILGTWRPAPPAQTQDATEPPTPARGPQRL